MTQQEFIEKQFPHSTTTFGQDLRSLIREENIAFMQWVKMNGWYPSQYHSDHWYRKEVVTITKTTSELYDEYSKTKTT